MFCVNGAAARKVQTGDKVIICTYRYVEENEVKDYKPTIVQIDENNNMV
jgi:aspartate 1-decarboxylase